MMGFDLLLIAGIIAYVFGWRPQLNQTGPAQNRQTALEILKTRYVWGELSRDQYESMKADIG